MIVGINAVIIAATTCLWLPQSRINILDLHCGCVKYSGWINASMLTPMASYFFVYYTVN